LERLIAFIQAGATGPVPQPYTATDQPTDAPVRSASGRQFYVPHPTRIPGGTMSEMGGEWLAIYPNNQVSLPSFNSQDGKHNGGGDLTVNVYLDSEKIAAKFDKQRGNNLKVAAKR